MRVITGTNDFFLGMQDCPEYARDVAHLALANHKPFSQAIQDNHRYSSGAGLQIAWRGELLEAQSDQYDGQ